MTCEKVHGHYISKATDAVYILEGFHRMADGEVMARLTTDYGETIWVNATWFSMNFRFVDAPYPPPPIQ